jgi:hypothetical protein
MIDAVASSERPRLDRVAALDTGRVFASALTSRGVAA